MKRRKLASGAVQFYCYLGGSFCALGTDANAARRRFAELLLDHERGTLGAT